MLISKRYKLVTVAILAVLSLPTLSKYNVTARTTRIESDPRQDSFDRARAILEDYNVQFVEGVPFFLWTFFMGEMSENRKNTFDTLSAQLEASSLVHIHITRENIFDFKVAPWHNVFEESLFPNEEGLPSLLSGIHISDYLRSYMGYYYGGWYTDVKAFNEGVDLRALTYEFIIDSNTTYAGFAELPGQLGFSNWAFLNLGTSEELVELTASNRKLISNGIYLAKPGNKLLEIQHELCDKYLSEKEEELRVCPAPEWRCCRYDHCYPISWTELWGSLTHSIQALNPTLTHVFDKNYEEAVNYNDYMRR